MLDIIKEKIPALKENWDKYQNLLKEITVDSKTVLLKEGEISKKIFFVKKGCLRLAYNNNGKDITLQFFFEKQAVSSMGSYTKNQPSEFSIESIEPSTLIVLNKIDLEKIMKDFPEIKYLMQEIMLTRLDRYARLFFSFIKDTPKQRYLELLKNEPHIIQRVPQHYIASYLGITPVSLSRIRKKVGEVESGK